MANENKIPEIIKSSLENIRSMVDANTIVGEAINTPQGTTIIPISKISVGIASGGVDYNSKETDPKTSRPQNFGGGGGTGLSISPVGFLTVDKFGEVGMITLEGASASGLDQIGDLLERTPDLIEKFKAVFKKSK